MAEWKIELEPSIVESLAESIRQGPAITTDDDGSRGMLLELTIGQINGVKVEIFADEHPPPHFRVLYQGSSANFTIRDCKMISGSGEVLHHKKKIRNWWKDNKQIIINSWNERRPTDCPVGEYTED